jgi:TRAP-type uncharacterized transport system substrate-binding protein
MAARGMQRFWPYFAIAGIIVILLGASGFIVETLPPRTIVMATGEEGGVYHAVGIRYREILAQAGVKLQLLPTNGGLDNLARLRDPQSGISVGIIQGGTTTTKESPNLESLGTVFYEPLWFFTRSEIGGRGAQGLRGRRVSIGPEGSGTRALALELLERNEVAGNAELLGLTPRVAAEKLIAGDIDAAFIVTSWDSRVVRRLVAAEGIELRNFFHADAYIGLYPFLNKLVLPAGVGDLVRERPPTDVMLLAPKASLVVRADLHPAIQYLLLDAAEQVHSEPGIFQKAGQFPAAEPIDIPLSEEAHRFYKTGRPFLQDYLPFWIATLTGRLLVVLIPLAALLYPLFRLMPQMYGWIMRSKITRLYDEMRSIEREMEAQGQGHDADAMIAKLDQLDQHANHLKLPTAYASMLYVLRAHIDLVRERLAISPDRKPH